MNKFTLIVDLIHICMTIVNDIIEKITETTVLDNDKEVAYKKKRSMA